MDRSTGEGSYEADLRVTTHGVVHVRAADWGGLGFGQGWACARDHLPTIADQIVKVRSERARFHGPGPQGAHIASDFGYLVLGLAARAADLRAAQPPWIRELVSGYVAGYNRRVGEVHAEGSLPGWCAGAAWIRPIDELDLYAYLGDVALLASGRNLAQLIGRAEAPGPDGPVPPSPMEALGAPSGASNGWAVGGDVSASGGGMVLANPHFPWHGEARFWECHLTIPGTSTSTACRSSATPGIQMGFNAGVGVGPHVLLWAPLHPVPAATWSPGDPTRYRFGDEVRPMTPADPPGGGADRRRRRVRRGGRSSEPCGAATTARCSTCRSWAGAPRWASAYRDANLDNTEVVEQFLRMGMATDMDDVPGGLPLDPGHAVGEHAGCGHDGSGLVRRRVGHPPADRGGPAAVPGPGAGRLRGRAPDPEPDRPPGRQRPRRRVAGPPGCPVTRPGATRRVCRRWSGATCW